MSITSLVYALSNSGLELDAEQIADVLWLLAAHARGSTYSKGRHVKKFGSSEPEQRVGSGPRLPKDDHELIPSGTSESSKSTGIALHVYGPKKFGSIAASAVALPGATAFNDALLLSRALRPFRRHVDSRYLSSIDVEATIEATAEARRLLVIQTAQSERWLDVALVADAGSSMIVWRDMLDQLEEILAQVGAFRAVSRWELLTDFDPVSLRDVQGAAHPLERLIDPSGRRLILVVSDGVSSAWHSEYTWTTLERWSSVMPTAIMQVLPTSYWPATGVGAPTIRLRATIPGSANSQLAIRWPWWIDREDSEVLAESSNPVPIPVIPLTAQAVADWAESITSGTSWTDGVLAKANLLPQISVEATVTGADRIRAFRERASYGAQRLAQILATAPRLSIPLIRILQSRLVPDTGTSELAEVFVNGLLQSERATQQGDSTYYVFREGVRELLSRGITGPQECDVFSAVSDYLAQQVGASSSRALLALIADPAGRETLSSHDEPFASLVGELASRLGLGKDTLSAESADSSVIDRDMATAPEARGTEQQLNDRSPALTPKHVAELIVNHPGGQRRGSGYRVTREAVLTAAHVVDGAVSAQVRFEPNQASEWVTGAVSWWTDPGSDLAVVSILQQPGEPAVNPTRFGRIGDQVAVLNVQAAGFPSWKIRDYEAATPTVNDRQPPSPEAHLVTGSAAVLASSREGTVEVIIPAAPAADTGDAVSPWAGMSGAALWVGDRVVGVLAEHHPHDVAGRMAANRLDLALNQLSPVQRTALRELIPSLLESSENLADVLPQTPRRPGTPYQALVADIAPDQLHDRDAELDQLVRFCAGYESYAWWQAGPWAGKTALLSWFVLHPPAGVDMVSFFITGRLPSRSDSDAFTDALIEQLAALVDEPPQVFAESSRSLRHGEMLHLLHTAAQRCAEEGRRLVLVVDGLDEDTSTTDNVQRPSIASLLPRHLPPEIRVLIASRAHAELPADVPVDHPLRTVLPRHLAPSRYALDVQIRATVELSGLLTGPPLQRDVLGLITASGGGLTPSDLKELTDRPASELEKLLAGPLGRIFIRKIPDRPDGRSADPVYLFAHQTLRDASLQALGDDLNGYLQRIDEWANSYFEQGFPHETPLYLLEEYSHLLLARGEVERAIRYQQALTISDNVASPQAMTDLVATMAEAGQLERAEALTTSITDPDSQARALSDLAVAMVKAGQIDRAIGLAAAIPDSTTRARTLIDMLAGSRGVGRRPNDLIDAAETAVSEISDPDSQARRIE